MNGIDTDDPIDARAVAAADGLIASFSDVDTETELRAVVDGSGSTHRDRSRTVRVRWIAIAAAAVLVIGGIVALAANVATRSPVTDAPTPSNKSVTTVATSDPPTTADTTTPPTTSAPTTTLAQAPATVAQVSYLDPPAELQLQPLATLSVPAAQDGDFTVAIGDLGVAVTQQTYGNGDEPIRIDVIDFAGQIRTIPPIDVSGLIAYGPGDVAYFTRQSTRIEDFAVDAVPLSGANAGTAVASEPADINLFSEYPPFSFGHGANGIIHRRSYLQDQPTIIDYVDIDGAPLPFGEDTPTFAFESPNDDGEGRGGTITASTGTSWALSVEAAPDRASPYLGASPPAPGSDGRGVYVTHIGPDAKPTVDFGQPTMWVIASMNPDGTATWWSPPNGWQVVASDIWGTVLARLEGTRLELALADIP